MRAHWESQARHNDTVSDERKTGAPIESYWIYRSVQNLVLYQARRGFPLTSVLYIMFLSLNSILFSELGEEPKRETSFNLFPFMEHSEEVVSSVMITTLEEQRVIK